MTSNQNDTPGKKGDEEGSSSRADDAKSEDEAPRPLPPTSLHSTASNHIPKTPTTHASNDSSLFH